MDNSDSKIVVLSTALLITECFVAIKKGEIRFFLQ